MTKHAFDREHYRHRCVHFTGVQHDQCKAGVDYEQVWTKGQGFPCLRDSTPAAATDEQAHAEPEGIFSGGDQLPCDQRRWPTEQEVDEQCRLERDRWERIESALPVIIEDMAANSLKKGHGGRGRCVCPTCGQPLHYSVATDNGHIHARCETDQCVAFSQ